MSRFVLIAIFAVSLAPARVLAQDTAPVVSLAALDPDARAAVVKQLEIRGYDPEGATLDVALRAFAEDHELASPERPGDVFTTTIDALGAGDAVALRWGAKGPRAPELAPAEIWRLNAALALRGLTERAPRVTVDADTIAALRDLQRATGHPVQQGELVERRWLFILGVATEESIPRPATPPAAPPR